jgi:alanine-synthesizing transaminase
VELRRVTDLPTYVFDVVDRWKAAATAEGRDIIDFGIGSHDLGTPEAAIDRLVAEARDPARHGYPSSAGLPELRHELARWFADRYAVTIDPETQALVTWGASEALSHLPWVLLGPGDTALVPGPCYPIHRYAVLFSGARPVPVPMLAPAAEADGTACASAGAPASGTEAGAAAGGEAEATAEDTDEALFERFVAAHAAARPRPRVALLSFPHNPTTRCVGVGFFERLVDFARETDLVIVHDFAYADIAFDGYRPPSILQVAGADEVAVELVSLSKSHNMAGWRLGMVAGRHEIVAALRRLKSYLDYGVTTPVQLMALTALRECTDTPPRMAATYQRRRDALCAGLRDIGWPVPYPRGTMFVWAPLPAAQRAMGSLAFARHLFDAAGIAVSPGIGFGPEGEGHVRFALVQPEARIREALVRLAPALHAG